MAFTPDVRREGGKVSLIKLRRMLVGIEAGL